MKDKVKHEVGRRMLQLRRALGLSRTEFAAKLLVARSTIYNNEKGVYYPGVQILRVLAADYRVSLEWLLCGNGVMFTEPPGLQTEIADFVNQDPAVVELLLAMKNERRTMYKILDYMEELKETKKV
ncbi:MAG: helix-turn-helix transcriptional regulator [bacterium]|nr:helix-turn-helix transcriptional regulator [bacterium]